MQNVYIVIGFVGLAAQLLVIHALMTYDPRRFGGVLFYLLVLFLTTVTDLAVFLGVGAWWPAWYREYYYLNNTLRHLSGFVALVSLVHLATAGAPDRFQVRVKIVAGALVVIAMSLLLASGGWPNQYMNTASRNLSFATVILNTALWLAMIKNRATDRRLFLVSGGLGLNMAGEAIGQSLLGMSPAAQNLGNVIAIGSHFLCLYIWWSAFRLRDPNVSLGERLTSY